MKKDLRTTIQQILKEETSKSKSYKYHEGGYLIPATSNKDGMITLTDDEFEIINGLNENLKEMYKLHLEKINLLKKYNFAVLQKAIDVKIRNIKDEIPESRYLVSLSKGKGFNSENILVNASSEEDAKIKAKFAKPHSPIGDVKKVNY